MLLGRRRRCRVRRPLPPLGARGRRTQLRAGRGRRFGGAREPRRGSCRGTRRRDGTSPRPGWPTLGARSRRPPTTVRATCSPSARKPRPPIGETTPGKHRSITSSARPSASSALAPRYESSTEMPRRDIDLRTPSSTAVRYFARTSSAEAAPGIRPSTNRDVTVARASRGTIASAPHVRRHAASCEPNASSATTTIEVRGRRPRSTSAVWTAPTASTLGIGARPAPAAPCVTTRTSEPARHAASASSASRRSAASSPSGPSTGSHVASSRGPSGTASSRKVSSSTIGRSAGALGQERGARPEQRPERHHPSLAQMVECRVRNLREALA